MSGGSFQVQPEDLKKAGDSAGQISKQMRHNSGDLTAAAKSVSGGLDGFALAGAHEACARAWEKELDSLAQGVHGAGEKLRNNAANYEKADEAGKAGLIAAGPALVPAG